MNSKQGVYLEVTDLRRRERERETNKKSLTNNVNANKKAPNSAIVNLSPIKRASSRQKQDLRTLLALLMYY